MRINNRCFKFLIFSAFLLSLSAFSFAQTANFPAPREEKLLNGLKLLVWSDPQAPKVSVKLRIHSGAAFDPQTKEGVMALLGEILFPNDPAREFFAEDLGGSLEITSSYDYIQIDATGDNDKILTILETLAAAVTKPQIDKDTTAKVKAAKLEKVKELEKNSSYIADQTVAKRLLGNFPYGRPQSGTSESLMKIDFADLLLAKQKFLTADNATLAISGNVRTELMFRAARRYFGGWEKADKKVPPTFTQPGAPDTKYYTTGTAAENVAELRYAFRGLARNDKDFAASQILTRILQNRLRSQQNEQTGLIRQEARLLPGVVLFQLSFRNDSIKVEGDKIELIGSAFKSVGELLKTNVDAGEFDKARSAFLSESGKQDSMNFWLDVDTFKLVSVKDELQKFNNIAVADVQRVLDRWRKEAVVMTLVTSRPATAAAN